ncbi:glycosyltransferase [Paenibacillus soyae]|uniref:Glycosyltransferase n=1 Tax=Paenibacillus soyae TaxID=2969249 RepID=A0A9X2MLN6_9BACL|nr:glycosyltransferase [Paenibacillus soyae]MCR2802510.1 glycosyltransferase [Paenibacillus soyae]
MIKVSIVIPVYNAADYLPRCIDSLTSQTLQECEFIFVNDGSMDESRAIIEQRRQDDERIILINQANQGVSVARNSGLKAARGEYIGFVDADDYVEREMYERLYRTAADRNCDAVFSNLLSELSGALIETKHPLPQDADLEKPYILEHVLPLFLKTEELNSACNKLYRRSLIKEHGIEFPRGVALGEDGMFNVLFLSHAHRIRYLDYAGYRYCEAIGSATRNASGKDYFARALEVFLTPPPHIYDELLGKEEILSLKSTKLIHSVMANIHIYLDKGNGMGLASRLSYVSSMVSHREVQRALPYYLKERVSSLGRYDKTILLFMQRRFVWGLYLVTGYSRFRNRKSRRVLA